MEKYNQDAQAKNSNESSAFAQVMAQMNIADIDTFNEHYGQLWQQASENNEMLSIMICEIDYFNEYNQHYGHQGAAFMLVVVALELKKKCEEFGGLLARYNTDKFAVLIKGEGIKAVEKMAETLRLSIEQTNTEHKASKVSDVVTLSIGTSNIYPTSMKMLMNGADTALNDSKVLGNRQTILSLVAKEEAQEEVQEKNSSLESTIAPTQQQEPLIIRTHSIASRNNVQAIINPESSAIKQETIEEKIEAKTEQSLNKSERLTPRKLPLSGNKSGLQHEEFDMISQLKGITPEANNIEVQQEIKSSDKVDLLTRFKKLIPSAKKSELTQEEKSSGISDQQSSNNNEMTPADTLKQQEKSEYDQLKAELEALKRKSEDAKPTTPPPVRYY